MNTTPSPFLIVPLATYAWWERAGISDGVSLQLGWVLATTSPFDGVMTHHTTREPALAWPTLWSSQGPREVGSRVTCISSIWGT